MRKNKAGRISGRALAALSADCVVKIIFAAVVLRYLCLRGESAALCWGIGIGVACVSFILLYVEAKTFYHPLRELERAAASMEPGEAVSDASLLERWNAPTGSGAIDRLIGMFRTVIKSDYDSRILKTQAEIHALQSQINPHFLYNTLETIRSEALTQNCGEIAEMTEALATLFRYSISRPGDMATLEQELENVENYLLIQQYRFPQKFEVVKHIEDESVLHCRLPVLTIQPLVENAIHHGLETMIGAGKITIRAFRTQQHMVVSVADNGCGMPPGRLAQVREAMESDEDDATLSSRDSRKKAGIALINVSRRIRFYYGPEYGLQIYSTEGVGTTVELTLPCNE
ncbi:MAG TPA: sensor histidine kinase [Eubacteriales bacterium]|nr:sensor histidine kinase [Eubacteriales bacterium]